MATVDRQRKWDTFGPEVKRDNLKVERAPGREIEYPLEGAPVTENTEDKSRAAEERSQGTKRFVRQVRSATYSKSEAIVTDSKGSAKQGC